LPKFDPGEGNQLKCCVAGTKFVKGGPVVSMQQLEGMSGGETVQTYRAMLLFSPYSLDTLKSNPNNQAHQPPIWCLPESFFPSKKLDTLPPRTAQPVLHFSRHYQVVGSGTFDPMDVMKSLHRIDQLIWSNRQLLSGGNLNVQANIKLIQRDVYLCEWLCQDGKTIHAPSSQKGQEYFPVCVCGAGRNSLLEGDENVLNVGILHIPAGSPKLSTLTLLPPDPHILFPLLVKAAEVEHRALKKTMDKIANGSGQSGINVSAIMRNVHLDDNWRAEFRAYLFRIPPYYQQSLRRCLRHVLPASVHCLLSTDTTESIILQCFSRQCYQKIRHGEQFSKENLERVERREEEYRKQIGGDFHDNGIEMRYGSYDRRMSLSNYLAALRNMPPPWRIGIQKTHKKAGPERKFEESSNQSSESQPQIDICKRFVLHNGLYIV
jgi:integrator complex subunit 6